jgi:hypothetical protein
MELEDLKNNWRKESKENLVLNTQSMEQLQSILKEKTSGTLKGMKKKYERLISFLLFGILLNVLINPFLHFLLGEEGPVFRITYGGLLSLITLIVICIIVVFFYWLKVISLKTESPDGELKSVLIKQINSLNRSLRQEIYFITAIFVFLFIIGRATSEYLGNGSFWDIFHQDILLAILAAICMLGFYIYKRVSFYKKNIHEFQKYLDEFVAEG